MELCHFTDTGPARPSNQDAYCIRLAKCAGKEYILAVLCDGMGGLSDGEIASASVVTAFSKWFDNRFTEWLSSCPFTIDSVADEWFPLITGIHAKLKEYGASRGIRLGTTVSAILMSETDYVLMQVGDSRIYCDDRKQMLQLTKDQTAAMRAYENGEISEAQLFTDKRNSVLLQCVGAGDLNPVFQSGVTPKTGGILLCSDGFYHNITSKVLHEAMMKKKNEDWSRSVNNLLLWGRNQGENDNMTVVALRWDRKESLFTRKTNDDTLEIDTATADYDYTNDMQIYFRVTSIFSDTIIDQETIL